MLQHPRKPGRPRKYASKEEKARQDVIAKRARRRLQTCRFRVHTVPKTKVGGPPVLHLNQTYLQPPDRLSGLAEVACSASPITTGPDSLPHPAMNTTVGLEPWLQRVNYPTTDNIYVSPYVLRLPPPRPTLSISPRLEDSYTQLRSLEATIPSISPLNESMQWDDDLHEDQDDDSTLGSGFRAGRPATMDADSGGDYDTELVNTPLPDPLSGTDSSSTNHLRDVDRGVSGDVSGRQEEVDDLEGCNSGRDSDIDPLLGNDFEVETETGSELESESGSRSDRESGRAEVQHMPHEQSCTIEPSPSSAKEFLESAWSGQCRCKQEERPGPDASNEFDLEQIAHYWKELGVPDSISLPSPGQPRKDDHEDDDLDWCAILAGGDRRPHLSFEKSQHVAPIVQRITHARRTTSYLTNEERCLWVDKLLLPAIRSNCPLDVIQYHPRSFDDMTSKAHSRRKEACSGQVRNDIDMHHYIPHEYLEAIWSHMDRGTASPDLTMFRDMFIVLSAKNIKLEAKSPTYQGCRGKIIAHLGQVLDWSKADLSNTWIDVGREDTAVSGGNTFLWKSPCLKSWIDSLTHEPGTPLVASEIFNWNLTDQAGSARVETRRSHVLHEGGLIYAQRYNVNKDLFHTASKRDHGLFGEPHLEGMTCPPSLLDAWIVAARQNRNAGLASSLQSRPQIKRLRKAFEAMKNRICHALKSSSKTSFGVREEYRISWALFVELDPPTLQPGGSHQPFWTLSTAHVNEFMRWEFNRWLSAIECVQERGAQRDCDWQSHQRNMIMVTILLRSLKASVNCHDVARRSQMFKKEYRNRQHKRLRGLDFEGSMKKAGLVWLPRDLFNWTDLCMHEELVSSTTFGFNGLRSVFRNWKDVNLVNQEYNRAKELENCLRSSEPEDRSDILDGMRKLVYQQFALHVIRQLRVGPHIGEDHQALQQGFYGLSFYGVYALVGEVPRLGRACNRNHRLGSTYTERLQKIFDWDDGVPRTFWDHCFYRQLARNFYQSISTSVSRVAADEWKRSLGRHALPFFWIIPHFDGNSLFCRPRKTDRLGANRSFLSGVFQWGFPPNDNRKLHDEKKWLFGGDMYLPGFPNCLTSKQDGQPGRNDINSGQSEEIDVEDEPQRTIDFGSAIPFSEIPQIIEDGFEVQRRRFAQGDQKVLAHYETAQECLAQALGDPLCDLLLILVMTICSSSERLDVRIGDKRFSVSHRPKNQATMAVCLVTRMLWFLRPLAFPWDRDNGQVLRVPEMIKKMGKCIKLNEC
ncbi:hypothetical protein VCV18_008994 [Metarhizium anisopliae]